MQKFYLSIDSINLVDCINRAIFTNIILRKNRFVFNGENVCLEIVLSDAEVKELQSIDNDLFLCQFALPISRIRMIIFDSAEQLQQTISTAEVKTIFILRNICVPIRNFEKFDKPNIEMSINIDENKLVEFDRYLGAMAFLRYKAIGDEILPCVFEYLDYFLHKKDKLPFDDFDKIKTLLESNLTEEIICNYANSNGLKYKKKMPNKSFKQDNESLNILAQIWHYCSSEASKNLSDLLQIDSYKLPNEREFYFALGYFVGYNKFETMSMNKKIKFEFNKFDLKIVEVVFSFVFLQQLNEEIIDFIDSSRAFTDHFANLLFDKNDIDRKILVNICNHLINYTKEQNNILRNENINLRNEINKLKDEFQIETLKLNNEILSLKTKKSKSSSKATKKQEKKDSQNLFESEK